MIPRSLCRVVTAFRPHSARRVPRNFFRTVSTSAGFCGSVETVRLPETLELRRSLRPCLSAVVGLYSCLPYALLWLFLPLYCRIVQGMALLRIQGEKQRFNASEHIVLMLQRLWHLAGQTTTTVSVSALLTASSACRYVKSVNGRYSYGGMGSFCMQRSCISCCSRRLLFAAKPSAVGIHYSQRHLALEGPTQPHNALHLLLGSPFTAGINMNGLSRLQLFGASWYARQARRLLVDTDSVRHLCQEMEMRTSNQHVTIVLGCIAALDSNSTWDVAKILECLPTADRATAVAALLVLYRVFPSKLLNEALATFLENMHTTHEEAWTVLQAMITAEDMVPSLHTQFVSEVVRRVVSSCRGVESRSRVVAALRFGETVVNAEALAKLCEQSGLWYESAAYRSVATGVLLETTVDHGSSINSWKDNECGFGGRVAALLHSVAICGSSRPPPVVAVEALRREMPHIVATYTMHRVAAELTRNEWKRGRYGAIARSDNFTALQYLQSAMPFLNDALRTQALKLHFDMHLGAVSTALLLLPLHRQSWTDTVKIMQHTHYAGIEMAINVLYRLMDLSPSCCYYVVARLQGALHGFSGDSSRGCTLLLEAKMVTDPLKMPDDVSMFSATRPWRRFVELAARQKLHVGHTLWSLPANCVFKLAAVMPQLPSSFLSAWILMLLRHKRYDSVYVVMQIAFERGVLPEMATLVEVLESVYANNSNSGNSSNNDRINNTNADTAVAELQRAVQSVRRFFPECAPSVFRAFVERAAWRVHKSAPKGWNAALHLVSTISVLGILHYPRSCLESIAACAPTFIVYAMLQVLSKNNDNAVVRYSSPAPLELGALHRILRSAELAGLRPTVDVIAVSPVNKRAAWWSSEKATAGLSMATMLYRLQAVGLWRHALQDVAWRSTCSNGGGGRRCVSNSEAAAHHALRLASFGTESVATVLRGVIVTQQQRQMHQGSQVTFGRRHRTAQAAEAMLVVTLACVAGALIARGRWEGALRIIPLAVTDLPSLLRVARLKALQCSEEFCEHATMLLESESVSEYKNRKCRRKVVGRHRGRRRRIQRQRGVLMPDGVRRLVAVMQMCDKFCWWNKHR